jgi:bis(5'-nucleosyl)-tetraphosphatase (symmetrical)
VTRYAIGDVQGCERELRALLKLIGFSADRDQLWFVGDLVNRGPGSLAVLRLVRALGDNAIVVLGNHDLHLLALAHKAARYRKSDTLEEVARPDRDALLEWLSAPAGSCAGNDLWCRGWVNARDSARPWHCRPRSVAHPRIRSDVREHGNELDCWDEAPAVRGAAALTINVLTRMRVTRRVVDLT